MEEQEQSAGQDDGAVIQEIAAPPVPGTQSIALDPSEEIAPVKVLDDEEDEPDTRRSRRIAVRKNGGSSN